MGLAVGSSLPPGCNMDIQIKTGNGRDRYGENHGGTDGDVEIAFRRRSDNTLSAWTDLDNAGDTFERGDFDSFSVDVPFGITELKSVLIRLRVNSERPRDNAFLDWWHVKFFNVIEQGVGAYRYEPDFAIKCDADRNWTV